MGRKRNPNRKPIPSRIRVQMYRARKKIKNKRQLSLNMQLDESDVQNDLSNNTGTAVGDESRSSRHQLRVWANSFRIATRALDSLLSILNSCGINSVPKNHRTLLETAVNIMTNEMAGLTVT